MCPAEPDKAEIEQVNKRLIQSREEAEPNRRYFNKSNQLFLEEDFSKEEKSSFAKNI